MATKQITLPEPAAVVPVSVDMRRLVRVGARPEFLDYLVQLWDFRQFIFYDARARVQSGTRRDRLGSAWLLLNPVFNGLTYYLIFGLLMNTSGGVKNYLGYLVIGTFLFQASAGAITSGARTIQNNRSIVQAFKFPRATLVLSVNLREILANVPLYLGMLILIIMLPPGEQISGLWLLIVPALFLQWIFNLGIGLILARIISKVNDVTHLLGFILRAWMYGSGVFYSYERFITHPLLLEIVKLNPLYIVLDIVRNCVLYATFPTWESWATLTAWSLGVLSLGMLFFWRGEESYGRE